ncbi:MAG: tetratricopeptide repeat protein [Kiritimatiellia bacterium]|nr:tetratricopeptide repeat protein [Kiritimatiellia bacterium]
MRMRSHFIGILCLAAALSGCGRPGVREARRGLKELDRDRPVRARALLESAINRRPGHPDNAPLWNAIGLACLRMNDEAAAIRALEESRRIDPNRPDAPSNLGLLYARRGDLTRAAPLLEEAALIDVRRTEPLEHLAAAYTAAGRWADAARTLEEARNRNPGSKRVLNALAAVRLGEGESAEATSLLLQALEIDSKYPPALYNLAVLHGFYLANPGLAAGFLRRFREVAPRHPSLAELSARIQPSEPVLSTPGVLPSEAAEKKLLEQARALAARGQSREALALCFQVAEQCRRDMDPAGTEMALKIATELAFDLPESHLAHGRFLEETGRSAAAATAYRRALALDSDSADALVGLARIARSENDDETARQTLQRVVEANPDHADACWELARLYDDETGRRPADAAALYRLFISRFPEDPRVADAVLRLRALTTPTPPPERVAPLAREPEPVPVVTPKPSVPERKDRKVEWKRSGRRNSDVAQQAYQRALAHKEQGDLDSAAHYFLRTLENDIRQVQALYQLAELYRGRGDLDLAQDAYRQAIELGPDGPQIRYNLATVIQARGRPDAAIEELRRAMALDPTFSPALYVAGLICAEKPERRAQARVYFARFLEVAPNDPLAGPVRDWLRAHP